MKNILIFALIVGLFNGCIIRHPYDRAYHSRSYDDNYYYNDRGSRYDNYERRGNCSHSTARMNVTRRHGRD